MSHWNERLRFWSPVVALGFFAAYLVVRLTLLHFGGAAVPQPLYRRPFAVQALRGGIYPAHGKDYPLACSVPVWSYYADPGAVRLKVGKRVRTRTEIADNVSDALGLDKEKIREVYRRTKNRYNLLLTSYDGAMHDKLTRRPGKGVPSLAQLGGIRVEEREVRIYPQGRRLSHVVGYVSRDQTNRVGVAGVEGRYEKYLHAQPGLEIAYCDVHGNRLEDRTPELLSHPENGYDVFLTVDHNVQFDVETALAEGVADSGSVAGWAIVLDAKSFAVLAMASLPDFEPSQYNRHSGDALKNRCVIDPYEPGSVMKTITCCAFLNEGMGNADTLYSTARNDPRYYRLPSDLGHALPAQISVQYALEHSINVVYGKIGVDVGPKRLRDYMVRFGFGARTGVGLPGETPGLLRPLDAWLKDRVKWSRAPIGQGISVSAMQLACAYATIANDGKRMRPYVVSRVVSPKGEVVIQNEPREVIQAIRPETARQVRQMMKGVAEPGGTARRAKVRGYSVAGKTGTAQIWLDDAKRYSDTLYNASFVGIVPAMEPRFVVLVTLHRPIFCRKRDTAEALGVPQFNHQGGICAAPVFRKISEKLVRYLGVIPDKPEELSDEDEVAVEE